jgi:hypothetical protein
MKAVGDLCGCGSPLPRAISIGSRAIARDDLDPWMRSEPLGQALGCAIREERDRGAALQINQHGAIPLAFPQGEVIHTEYPGRGERRGRLLAEQAQQGVAAHR